MNKKTRTTDALPILLMGGLFVVIHLLALLVAAPFRASGVIAFPDPNDPMNLVYFFLLLLVFTIAILLISKFWKKEVVRIIVLGATAILAIYVFYPLFSIVIPQAWLSLGLSIAFSTILLIMLVKKPEWYILDLVGIFTAVGEIAMLGISLNILIVIVLLIAMSIYDAISVYRTKHMIDLADTLIDQKLPVLFVIPKRKDYSLVEETKSLKEKLRDGEERDAFFLGVGDVVFPGILAVAAFYSLSSYELLVALSVILGTLVGFVVLMAVVIKGKPQAGLPYLCTGAILGYLVASFLIFGTLAI